MEAPSDPPAAQNAKKVFVGNLPFKITKNDLEALFSRFGTVIGINIREDRTTGKPKGFGFVTFDSDEPAAAAIASMHGYSLEGRPLTVNAATLRGTGALDAAVDDSWKTVPTPAPSAQGRSGALGCAGGGAGAGGKKGGKGKGTAVGRDGKEHATWDQWAGPVAKKTG